ncbi:MAG: hypothetical protein NZ604_07260 [Flavobacteriales bacterium]|nr:hypothetical protein [Flavobacteriales bacterium]
MQSTQFIELIQKPESILKEDLSRLDDLCNEYPYCSSLHKLRLKALKEANSEAYNKELKMTAAISGNRTILFEYITQKSFQAPIKELVKQIKQKPEQTLDLGKPLEFDDTEKHSFSEWLKLSQLKPIDREAKAEKKEKLNPIEKTNKIVDFITETKKKERPKKEFFSPSQVAQQSLTENDKLMTETLAKVYLEQGHYDKAIIAYEILSLKYPQKSSLFANQIKAIKQINP